MAIDVVMPRLGWTMEEGTLVEWTKNDGDTIATGDVIMLVQSDKAVTEVESFDDGVLRIPSSSPAPGTTVPIGTFLAFILQPGEEMPDAPSGTTPATVVFTDENRPPPTPDSPRSRRPAAPAAIRHGRARGPAISPRARRIAVELGVDWQRLQGSGNSGRIVEQDVRTAADRAPAAAAAFQSVEVDMGQFIRLHGKLETLMKRAPTMPDLLALLLRAAGEALNQIPLTPEIDDVDVRVLRDGDTKSFSLPLGSVSVVAIAEALTGNEAAAQQNASLVTIVAIDDIEIFAPVLQSGSAAVMGIGGMRECNGRHSIHLRLTYDGDSIADEVAYRFLGTLRSYVENPYTWLAW